MKKIKFIMLSAVMLMASTSLFAESSVTAKNFDPYAQIRLYLGYQNLNPEKTAVAAGIANSETQLVDRLQGNSRFGANFEVDNAKVQVEFGFDPQAAATVSLRIAKATFDFSGVKVMVGQDYTPNTWLAVGDYVDDNNLTGFGASYDKRAPQLLIGFMGAYIDFITPSTSYAGYSATTYDTTVVMPKTVIGYDFKSGDTVVGFGAGMNMVKIHDATAGSTVDGKKITSYIGFVHANLDLGMLVLRGNFAYEQNPGNYGIQDVASQNKYDSLSISLTNKFASAMNASSSSGSVKNTTSMEGYINPMIKLSSDLMIGAGVGYAQVKNDNYAKKDSQICYFVDAKYSLTKQLAILPEFSYRDYQKDVAGNKQGTEYYAGAQIQVKI